LYATLNSPRPIQNNIQELTFVHANTKLIDTVTYVCYDELSASWELDSTTDNEDGEPGTDDTGSLPETEQHRNGSNFAQQ